MQGKSDKFSNYQEYIIGKKEQRRKKRIVIRFNWVRIVAIVLVLCVFAIGVVVFCAYNQNVVRFNRKGFYFLQFHEYDNLNLANNAAINNKSDGGAGYILCTDKFRIMAFVYQTQADAEKVVARLNEGGENACVFPVEFGDKTISGYDDKTKTKKLKSFVDRIFLCFDRIYLACIRLDKEEISESLAVKEADSVCDLTDAASFELKKEDFGDRTRILSKIFSEINTVVKKELSLTSSDSVSQHLKSSLCSIAIIISDNLAKLN